MAQDNTYYKKIVSAAYIVAATIVIAVVLLGKFGPITTVIVTSLSTVSIGYGDTNLTGDPLFRWMRTPEPHVRQVNLLMAAIGVLVWMKVFH